MALTTSANAHFWLFQAGALVLLITLILLISETVSPATFGPVILVSELLVLCGIVAFMINLFRHV